MCCEFSMCFVQPRENSFKWANSLQIINEIVFSHLTSIYPIACKIVGVVNSWHPEGPAPNSIQFSHGAHGEK